MPKILFVSATNTDVGKTYATLRLMDAAARAGLKPAAFKPIETGVVSHPPDGTLLWEKTRKLNDAAGDLSLEDIVPCRYPLAAAPYVAKGEAPVDDDAIDRAFDKIRHRCDILFVEGAGGLLVPIDEKRFMIDLPRRFGAHTLLIAPGGLGAINDTLLSLEALRRRSLPHTLVVNLHPQTREAFKRLTRPYYDGIGLPYRLLDDADRLLKELLPGSGVD